MTACRYGILTLFKCMVISDVYPVDQNNNPPASVGNLKVNIDESVLKKWRLAGFWSDAPVHHSAGLIFVCRVNRTGSCSRVLY